MTKQQYKKELDKIADIKQLLHKQRFKVNKRLSRMDYCLKELNKYLIINTLA